MSRKHNSQDVKCVKTEVLSPRCLGVYGYVNRFKWHHLRRGRQIIKKLWQHKRSVHLRHWNMICTKRKSKIHLSAVSSVSRPRSPPRPRHKPCEFFSVYREERQSRCQATSPPGDPPGLLQSARIWPAPLPGGARGV